MGVSTIFLSPLYSVTDCFFSLSELLIKFLLLRDEERAGDCWAFGGSFDSLPDGGILLCLELKFVAVFEACWLMAWEDWTSYFLLADWESPLTLPLVPIVLRLLKLV